MEAADSGGLKDQLTPDSRVIPDGGEVRSDCVSGGEDALVDDPDVQMLDVFPRKRGNDFVSLALFGSRKAFDKGLQFADGEALLKKDMGDA